MFDSLSGFLQIEERQKYSPSPFMFMYVISFYTCVWALACTLLSGEYRVAVHVLLGSEEALFD